MQAMSAVWMVWVARGNTRFDFLYCQMKDEVEKSLGIGSAVVFSLQ